MAPKTIQTEVAEAFGRTFVKGNLPEIHPIRCFACGDCITLCKKLGPDVLREVDGVAKVAYAERCIGDGACIVVCPSRAIFLMSKYDPAHPPSAV